MNFKLLLFLLGLCPHITSRTDVYPLSIKSLKYGNILRYEDHIFQCPINHLPYL